MQESRDGRRPKGRQETEVKAREGGVGGPLLRVLVRKGSRKHWRVLFQALSVQLSPSFTQECMFLCLLCSPCARMSGGGRGSV